MHEQISVVKEIFTTALELDSEDQRRDYLEGVCAGDPDRRAEVDALLAAHSAAGGFLTRTEPLEQPTLLISAEAESPGTRIGPYTIREKIGEGGMGVVYVAEQTRPIRRKVALKVIKPGMDTREVVARFEAERQALAMMDHPNIARVLDAGTTGVVRDPESSDRGLTVPDTPPSAGAPRGRPYFVMELVRGNSITRYCDEARLGTRERLKLFVAVCQAVQHAHQKGVIHRDLKPSNVLVTLHDGVPVPKVIDFGVAKALDQELTERTIYTQFHQMVGTPTYMSPEQAEMSGLDIDTRTDVYSLGVLLYELLTGTTPFDRRKLMSKGFDEMRRIIREADPLRPSHRLSTLSAAAQSTLQQSRGVDVAELSRSLRRELDWIVMKALEKDRARRYESASALARDIQRYLEDEPVRACPPSLGYRLRKYARRHKFLLMSAVLVLLTAVVGTAVSLWYAGKATLNAYEARSAQANAETQALEAQRATEWSETLLYAADMKLVSDAIAHDDVPRAAELLQRHRPVADGRDLRGFEWGFFRKRVNSPPGVTLEPGGRVWDVEVSPDGQWLAATGPQGTVHVYETATWEKIHSFPTRTDAVNGLAWSPDGTLLAAACEDGTIRVWNFPSFTEQSRIEAHEGGANDVSFSPDGDDIYSGGDDRLVGKWNLATGEPQLLFTGHEREVEQIALSADGSLLATASADDSLAIWNAETGERLHQIEFGEGGGRAVCVAFSPDGRFVAAGNIHGSVCLADTKSGNWERLPRAVDGVEAVTWFAGGQWLATADRGGAIQLHPVPESVGQPAGSTPARPSRWIAHDGRALSLAVTRDGQSLISGGRDGAVRVWTPDLQATRWIMDSHASDFSVAVNGRLYVAGDGIDVWDLGERRQIDSFAATGLAWRDAACSADGRFLAAARVGRLVLFDLTSLAVLREWPLEERIEPRHLTIAPDGRSVAFVDYTDREFVAVYDREGPLQPRRFPARLCETVAFSPDGRWLAAGHYDDVHLFDLRGSDEVRVLKGHSNTLSGLAFSPDGRLLATVSHDRLLKVWRMPTGDEVFSTVAHRDAVNSVAFTPDGRTIATAGRDRIVKLWHVATGQPLGEAMEEHDHFDKIRFSADGQRLIALLDDGSVVVYDASPAASDVQLLRN